MYRKKEYNIHIEGLFHELRLGDILELPEPINGGLLHKSFKVKNSDNKIYFVKALNPQIMARPEALANYTFSDEVSILAKEAGIPASVVLQLDGRTIHSYEGQHYQLFDWISGISYDHFPGNSDICIIIGRILGDLHNVDFGSISKKKKVLPKYEFVDWEGIISTSIGNKEIPERISALDIGFIKSIESVSVKAYVKLKEFKISHRDLDPKNIMWLEINKPIIIDWEASGYVNPILELVEVALYWSEEKNGSYCKTAFLDVFRGYLLSARIIPADIEIAFDSIMKGRIGWIKYNLIRAVGKESISEEDQLLGIEQVEETIKTIKQFQIEKDGLLLAIRELL